MGSSGWPALPQHATLTWLTHVRIFKVLGKYAHGDLSSLSSFLISVVLRDYSKSIILESRPLPRCVTSHADYAAYLAFTMVSLRSHFALKASHLCVHVRSGETVMGHICEEVSYVAFKVPSASSTTVKVACAFV